jgi:hypothetical protein
MMRVNPIMAFVMPVVVLYLSIILNQTFFPFRGGRITEKVYCESCDYHFTYSVFINEVKGDSKETKRSLRVYVPKETYDKFKPGDLVELPK